MTASCSRISFGAQSKIRFQPFDRVFYATRDVLTNSEGCRPRIRPTENFDEIAVEPRCLCREWLRRHAEPDTCDRVNPFYGFAQCGTACTRCDLPVQLRMENGKLPPLELS